MPKLVINDKSGKKNTSMNFFLDDKVIKFKENKKKNWKCRLWRTYN